MSWLCNRVTGGAVRQALLEASSWLVKECPCVLLADGGVKRFQNLLQVDAVGGIQRTIRAAGCPNFLPHHTDAPTPPENNPSWTVTISTSSQTPQHRFPRSIASPISLYLLCLFTQHWEFYLIPNIFYSTTLFLKQRTIVIRPKRHCHLYNRLSVHGKPVVANSS